LEKISTAASDVSIEEGVFLNQGPRMQRSSTGAEANVDTSRRPARCKEKREEGN